MSCLEFVIEIKSFEFVDEYAKKKMENVVKHLHNRPFEEQIFNECFVFFVVVLIYLFKWKRSSCNQIHNIVMA